MRTITPSSSAPRLLSPPRKPAASLPAANTGAAPPHNPACDRALGAPVGVNIAIIDIRAFGDEKAASPA